MKVHVNKHCFVEPSIDLALYVVSPEVVKLAIHAFRTFSFPLEKATFPCCLAEGCSAAKGFC